MSPVLAATAYGRLNIVVLTGKTGWFYSQRRVIATLGR